MEARAREARLVADVVAQALEAVEQDQSPISSIAVRLGEAVRADCICFGWLDVPSGACHLRTWPDIRDPALMLRATTEIPRSHPVLNFWMAGNTDVAAVSSLVTDRVAWRNSAAYALLRTGLGCTETAGVRLEDGGHTLRMIGFARHRDFSPAELDLLAAVRRPVLALCRHADWLAGLRTGHDGDGARRRASALGLTTRELEVLQLLAEGFLASSIASRLLISTRTVHRHLGHIYGKLETHDRLTTVMRAQRLGLLPPARPDPDVAIALDDPKRSATPGSRRSLAGAENGHP